MLRQVYDAGAAGGWPVQRGVAIIDFVALPNNINKRTAHFSLFLGKPP